MFLNESDNMRYKKLKTEQKKRYIMGLDGYPQDLPAVMKILHSYITESEKKRNRSKTPGKYQIGVTFVQNQDKENTDKNKINRKGYYHCF